MTNNNQAKQQPRLSRAARAQVTRAQWRLGTVESQEFASQSQPGVTYLARIMQDGKVTCNCKRWTLKRRGQARGCSHAAALVNGRPTEQRGDFYYLRKE